VPSVCCGIAGQIGAHPSILAPVPPTGSVTRVARGVPEFGRHHL
jgi:hypothetical protein